MGCSLMADRTGNAPATAIILAAQRDGRLDPLAAAQGVSHKCLIPIAGRPLLAHVLEPLGASPEVGRIRIVVEAGAQDRIAPIIASFPDLASRIELVEAAASITDSVYAGVGDLAGPFLVTAADNVLLAQGPIRQVMDRLRAGDDTVVTMARRGDVLAVHPQGQRHFYHFRDDAYCNCNLYGLSDRSVRLAEAFRTGGQFVKNPRRIAAAFGIFNLLLLRFGLVSLDRAMARLSRRFGVRISALVLEDGSYAIDVDNERTYRIAAGVLESRMAA